MRPAIAALTVTLALAAAASAQSTPSAGGQTAPTVDQPMTAAEYQDLIRKANANRLAAERNLVATEIQSGFNDPAAAERAVGNLNDRPKNTQQDNIDRICRAFAQADPDFAKLYKLYSAGKFKDAVALGKAMVNDQSSFLQTAKGYIYCRSLEALPGGSYEEAGDAYIDLVSHSRTRISFAADAVARLAELYERNGRNIYAMESWALLLQDYGLTLEPARFDALVAKVKDLQSQYADPLGTVAAMMSKVKERLARIDSGQGTQATQRRIVAMLNDLIRTEEDKDRAGGATAKCRPQTAPRTARPWRQANAGARPNGQAAHTTCRCQPSAKRRRRPPPRGHGSHAQRQDHPAPAAARPPRATEGALPHATQRTVPHTHHRLQPRPRPRHERAVAATTPVNGDSRLPQGFLMVPPPRRASPGRPGAVVFHQPRP